MIGAASDGSLFVYNILSNPHASLRIVKEFNTHRSRDSTQRQLSAIINYNIDGVDNFDPEYIMGRTTGDL